MREPPVVDGFDAHPGLVNRLKNTDVYRRVWEQVLPSPIEGNWDTVLACELVEHLPFELVEETISILEKCATQRIIVSTPNFRCLRTCDTNPYDSHLSYVPARFFKRRGYRLIGVGWPNPRIRGTRLLRALGLDFLFHGFPSKFAFTGSQLVAYKDLDQSA